MAIPITIIAQRGNPHIRSFVNIPKPPESGAFSGVVEPGVVGPGVVESGVVGPGVVGVGVVGVVGVGVVGVVGVGVVGVVGPGVVGLGVSGPGVVGLGVVGLGVSGPGVVGLGVVGVGGKGEVHLQVFVPNGAPGKLPVGLYKHTKYSQIGIFGTNGDAVVQLVIEHPILTLLSAIACL